MIHALDPEEARLDVLWRRRFGQPLPIRGCVSLALEILGETAVFAPPGLSDDTVAEALGLPTDF
jgi:hypothetical protein